MVYKTTPSSLTVLDTRTLRRFSTSVDSSCSPISASSGIVLLHCSTPDPTRYALFDIASRTTRELTRGNTFATYNTIGRYWAAGPFCDAHCGVGYLNWRTGETRVGPTSPTLDIDTPNLRVYDARAHDVFSLGGPGRRYLFVRRRGLRSQRVLVSRCPMRCDHAVITGRRIAWLEGTEIRSYAIVNGRRCEWRVPNTHGLSPYIAVTLLPTPYRMVVAVSAGLNTSTSQLYQAPWC